MIDNASYTRYRFGARPEIAFRPVFVEARWLDEDNEGREPAASVRHQNRQFVMLAREQGQCG